MVNPSSFKFMIQRSLNQMAWKEIISFNLREDCNVTLQLQQCKDDIVGLYLFHGVLY